MKRNILYILSSYNRFSGTPKKTFDLIKYSEHNSYLYVWSVAYQNDFKEDFSQFCVKIIEGNYGRNLLKHVKKIIKTIDKNKIKIIQTHFFFGELLIGIVKHFRPKVKVIVSFEGSMSAGYLKRTIQKIIYKKFNSFVYISNYVKKEKETVFPQLKKANTKVIYNGTTKLLVDEKIKFMPVKAFRLISVSSLIDIKNIEVLLDMMLLFKKENHLDIHLYIVGDGVLRKDLEAQVFMDDLTKNVHFLGRKKNIGNLLHTSDVLVHPCYIEAFGLSVVEAMMAGKPVVVANSGAFPEMIKHKETGFLVDPFNAKKWKNTILEIKNDKDLVKRVAKNGMVKVQSDFSIDEFVANYNQLYKSL
jgi:glycosyltransferase involved in cell wall biosynthesis